MKRLRKKEKGKWIFEIGHNLIIIIRSSISINYCSTTIAVQVVEKTNIHVNHIIDISIPVNSM